jgi:hypothetical protein
MTIVMMQLVRLKWTKRKYVQCISRNWEHFALNARTVIIRASETASDHTDVILPSQSLG